MKCNEFDAEYEFCKDCWYYGEPNGCNRPDGECEAFSLFIEIYEELKHHKEIEK